MIINPAAALAALNTTTLSSILPGTFPQQSILCYDRRYADYPPVFADCERIIRNDIATGPRPDTPIIFSRNPLPGRQNRVPKAWTSLKSSCDIIIDVPTTLMEESNLLEIQATARAILMKCVLGSHHLGGMTFIGKRGGLSVQIIGRDIWKETT